MYTFVYYIYLFVYLSFHLSIYQSFWPKGLKSRQHGRAKSTARPSRVRGQETPAARDGEDTQEVDCTLGILLQQGPRRGMFPMSKVTL